MRPQFLVMCLLCLVTETAVAEHYSGSTSSASRLMLFRERADTDEATGIAVTITDPQFTPYMDLGISASRIKSDKPLVPSGRKIIHPFYVFATFKLNTAITPFAEIGLDLGEIILNEIADEAVEDVDGYYAYGLKTSFNDVVNFAIYRKSYDLYFRSFHDDPPENTVLNMTGASIIINF